MEVPEGYPVGMPDETDEEVIMEVVEVDEVAEATEKTVDDAQDEAADDIPTVMTRSRRSIKKHSRRLQVTKVNRENWKMEASTIEIKVELRKLFQNL